MALMTPRGLKIRLAQPWAFGLLARLWGKDERTDAFRVLRTCEAIELVPSTLAFILATVAAFYTDLPVWSIAAAHVLGAAVGILLTQFGLFVVIRPIGLLWLAYISSWIPGNGILLISGIAIAWVARGWVGALWWFIGVLSGACVRILIEFKLQSWRHSKIGYPVSAAEINFFNSYRLHADRLGITRNLEVSDAEIETGAWRDCLVDYAVKYPESVARFPLQTETSSLFDSY